jgi:GT2 family glycosyltransferase
LLTACLDALFQSRFLDFEVIVVDDASTDNSLDTVRSYNVQIIDMPYRSGPAAARNSGSNVAQGDYLVFIDADVMVHTDTLTSLLGTFTADATVDAVFGSYDAYPSAPNFISHYKNLFHHYVHQNSHEQASTFWSGCGAVKRTVFAEVRGFDPSFKRPTVEDIELGNRLYKSGYRIVLNKAVQVTHAKSWSFTEMIKSDIWDRAIPWTRLILRQRSLPDDLNLTWSQRLSAILACALFAVLSLGALQHPSLIVIPLLVFVLILTIDYWSARSRIPDAARWIGVVFMISILGIAGFMLQELAFVSALLMAGVVALNTGLYRFFLREREPLFAVAILPLHLFYYVYSGIAFLLEAALYLLRQKYFCKPDSP